MSKPNSEQRRTFAQHYAISGNATAAAKAAGVPASSAHSMGYKWLRNTEVRSMLREEVDSNLRALAPLAVATLRDLLSNSDVPPSVRLGAARDALDRLGLMPPKRIDPVIELEEKDVTEMTRAELELWVARNGVDCEPE